MTAIQVTKHLCVESLFEVENPEFGHWYELGVWWALYGDGQGKGAYDDRYLIDNLTSHIESGWYNDPVDGWFPMLGFELGMIHGGMIDPITHELRSSVSLVILTDSDFSKGYHVGRDYCFNEAPLEGRIFSDKLFCSAVQEWALDYHNWREPEPTLSYCLGCRIGELSGALFPEMMPATAS